MANLQQVSFTNDQYAPDVTQIERQRKLAEMLQQQSQTPMDTNQMAGGWVVPVSPMQGLAKIAQAFGAKKAGEKSDELVRQLRQNQSEDARLWAQGMPQARPESVPNYPGEVETHTGKMIQPTRQEQLAWALQGISNPLTAQIAAKSAGNLMTPFDPNTHLAHLNPGQFTPESWAKYVQTGDTTHLRPTASPGQIMANAMQAAQLKAKLQMWSQLSAKDKATLVKDIQEYNLQAAKFGYESGIQMPPMELPMNGVPVPDVQIPGGQPPAAPAQPAGDYNFGQFGSGQVPNDISDADAMALWKQSGAVKNPQPPQRPAGTPLVPGNPALSLKAQQALEAERPDQNKAAQSSMLALHNALQQVNAVANAPGLSNITGPVMGRLGNITGSATNAQAHLDTLKSQIGVQVLNAMREASKTGGAVGSVTEKEWPILQNQLGALQQSQTTEQFKKNLADVRQTIQAMQDNIRRAYESKYGALDFKPPGPGASGSWGGSNDPLGLR